MSRLSRNCLAQTPRGETLDDARTNLKDAVIMMVLEANRELSERSLRGADVIREALTLPAA
jgi:predicted RNase H-like HicB family nuclease